MTERAITGKDLQNHKWQLRDDEKYQCAYCGVVATKQTLSVMRGMAKTTKLPSCKGAKLSSRVKKPSPILKKPNPLIAKEIKALFVDSKVVSFEQIEPYIPEDNERFWTGVETEEQSMLEFLEEQDFDVIECRIKDEKYRTEIYVNWEKFRSESPKPKPSINSSEQAKELENIDLIEEKAKEMAVLFDKGAIDVSKYRDGFKIAFFGRLIINEKEFKLTVLKKLAQEMKIEFPELLEAGS